MQTCLTYILTFSRIQVVTLILITKERKHGMLLALIVRGRRKRPRDTYYISLKKAKEKSSKSSPPQLTDEEIKDMVEHSGETPRKKSKDSMDEDYDPAMAGQGFGGGEDEASESVNRTSNRKSAIENAITLRS